MEPPVPSVAPRPNVALDSTLGALLICIIGAVALFGMICLQTYQYFNYYTKDKLYIKLLVGTIWCLEFVHTVVIVHALYRIVVTDFGVSSLPVNQPVTLNISVIFSGLINTGVQGFFAYRVKLISKRWLVPTICWSILVIRLSCVIAASIVTLQFKYTKFITHYEWLLILLLVATAIGDIVLAGAMTYFLSQCRGGFLQTNRVINYLIMFSIETGLITSLVAVIVLIVFFTNPSTYAWVGLLLVLAKIYTNSLLLSLNNRKHMRSAFVGYYDSGQWDSLSNGQRDVVIEMSPMATTTPPLPGRKGFDNFVEGSRQYSPS